MAYLFIALSAVCSLVIVHLLKITETSGLRTLNTLTVNYLVAAIFAFAAGEIWNLEGLQPADLYPIVILCLIVGAIFIGNFIVYGKSVHINGMGISIAAMRISLLIPVFISIFLYGDLLNWATGVGGLLVLVALLLLVPKGSKKRVWKINAAWLLLITFLLSGLADSSLKLYHEELSLRLNELAFMGLVFAGAFIIGLVISLFGNGPLITTKELKVGAWIGIPNLYSSVFLIYALDDISGAVAFPLVNTLNVLGGTLWGLFRWNDSVSRLQWLGIGIAILAVILLI